MNNSNREWTDYDLDRLRQLDDRNLPTIQIAEELQRSQGDVEDRLSIARARSLGPQSPVKKGGEPLPQTARRVSAETQGSVPAMNMKQKMGEMGQIMSVAQKASNVSDDEVTIAADDAGATALTQKIGTALEDEQLDFSTRDVRDSDDRSQQATSPIGKGPRDAASTEIDRALIRQADENAKLTDEQMRKSGFGDHKGTEGF